MCIVTIQHTQLWTHWMIFLLPASAVNPRPEKNVLENNIIQLVNRYKAENYHYKNMSCYFMCLDQIEDIHFPVTAANRITD